MAPDTPDPNYFEEDAETHRDEGEVLEGIVDILTEVLGNVKDTNDILKGQASQPAGTAKPKAKKKAKKKPAGPTSAAPKPKQKKKTTEEKVRDVLRQEMPVILNQELPKYFGPLNKKVDDIGTGLKAVETALAKYAAAVQKIPQTPTPAQPSQPVQPLQQCLAPTLVPAIKNLKTELDAAKNYLDQRISCEAAAHSAELQAARTEITKLQTQATKLESIANGNAAAIGQAQTGITKLQSQASRIEAAANGNATAIGQVQTGITKLSGDIGSAQQNITQQLTSLEAALKTEITSAKSEATRAKQEASAANSKLIQVIADIGTVGNQVQSSNQQLAGLIQGASQQQMTAIQSLAAQLQTELNKLQAQGQQTQQEAQAANAQAAQNGQDISSFRQDVDAKLQQADADRKSQAGTLQSKINAANAEIANARNDIGAVQQQGTQIAADIGSIKTSLGTASVQIGQILSDLGTYGQDIQKNYQELQKISTALGGFQQQVQADYQQLNTAIQQQGQHIQGIENDQKKAALDIAGLRTDIQNAYTQLDTLINSMQTAVNTELQKQAKQMQSIESSQKQAASDIAGIRTDMNSGLSTLDTRINTVDANIKAVGGDVKAVDGSVKAVHGDVKSLDGKIQQIDQNLTQNLGQIVNILQSLSQRTIDIYTAVNTINLQVQNPQQIPGLDKITNALQILSQEFDNMKNEIQKTYQQAENNGQAVAAITQNMGELVSGLKALSALPDILDKIKDYMPTKDVEQELKNLHSELNRMGGEIMAKIDGVGKIKLGVAEYRQVDMNAQDCIRSISVPLEGERLEDAIKAFGSDTSGSDERHMYEFEKDVGFVYANLAKPAKEMLQIPQVKHYLDALIVMLSATEISGMEDVAPEKDQWQKARTNPNEIVYQLNGTDTEVSIIEQEGDKENEVLYRFMLIVQPNTDYKEIQNQGKDYVHAATMRLVKK
jgi:chromosome segregation ATPase